MALNPHSDLSITQMVYFFPCLLAGLYLVFRNGLREKSAFLFVSVLALIRIFGAAMVLAAGDTSDRSTATTLLTIGEILSAVGLSALISALLSLLSRVNNGLSTGSIIPPRLMRLVHLAGLVGVVLSAIGANGEMSTSSSGDKSTSQNEFRAGVVIFFVLTLLVAGVLALLATKHRSVKGGERRLLVAVAAAWPFLLVRSISSLAIAFTNSTTSVFSLTNPNIYVEAFMSALEEFVVVGIVILVGFMVEQLAVSGKREPLQQSSYQMLGQHGVPKYDPRSGYENFRPVDPAAERLTPSLQPAQQRH